MKTKIFMEGVHSRGELEEEVNDFLESEGVGSEDLAHVKALSPDTGEIALALFYSE